LFQLIPYFKSFDDSKSVKTTKLLVLFCGIISTLFAFIISQLGGNLIQVSSGLNGSFNAPIIGLFLLGSCFSITNSKGAIAGTIIGFMVGLWISFGAYAFKPNYPKLPVESIDLCKYENVTGIYLYEAYFEKSISESNKFNSSFMYSGERASNLEGFNIIYSMSYMWLSTFGTLITVGVGVVVSLLTKGYESETDSSYLIIDLMPFLSKTKKKQTDISMLKLSGHSNNAFDS
jgi:sodium-coupled monocarboxylate transporter 8/12